jgi:flavodoxin I
MSEQQPPPKGLVLYGTLTGNTEMAAKALYGKLIAVAPGRALELANVRDVAPEQLRQYDYVIFGASTWDDYGNPDTEDFLAKLKTAAPDLSGVKFAFFGLGDSSYHNFCGAIDLAKQVAVGDCHCAVYPEAFTIDGYPEEEMIAGLARWAQNFLSSIESRAKI